MRGTERHSTKGQGSGSRSSARSNRATGRSSRKEVAPPSTSATRSHHHQIQAPLPPPTNEHNPGPFEYLPNLLPPTTTGMAPSEPSSIEPSLQTLPITQPYPSTMSSAPFHNDSTTVLPSPGATTPTTGTSLPSPPPHNNTNTTSMPEYPQSAYNYGTWTAEEDKTLLSARGQGHHWAQIQRTHFPSKTANACRKRYERLMERRGIHDLDREKLEKVAHEYMGMRKEIWANLAARVGERWNVVEAQCMSSGLRTIQLNARSHARRQRHESRVSQRSSATAQQHYPYLNTTDNGMLDMINHHHQHPGGHGGNIGNTLLAPVGFAPISPLDDDHPGPHHRPDQTYNHSQQGGWHNGQQQHQHHEQQGYGNTGDNSSSGTPTAEMVTPTTSTSSAEQGQGYRDYTQHHQPQYPSYGPGPPSSSSMDANMAPNMGYHTGYNMPGPSHRR